MKIIEISKTITMLITKEHFVFVEIGENALYHYSFRFLTSLIHKLEGEREEITMVEFIDKVKEALQSNIGVERIYNKSYGQIAQEFEMGTLQGFINNLSREEIKKFNEHYQDMEIVEAPAIIYNPIKD